MIVSLHEGQDEQKAIVEAVVSVTGRTKNLSKVPFYPENVAEGEITL